MILLNQKATYVPQEPGIEGIEKIIEIAGRTCYKSLDKITSDSAHDFVQRMINSKHTAMLEHGAVYLTFKYWKHPLKTLYYLINKFSKIRLHNGTAYVSTNYRVICDNNRQRDLKFMHDNIPTYHEPRYLQICETCIHVYKDLTRHRVMSFAIESTRFCNYLKEKFGAALKFMIPTWLKDKLKPGEYIFKATMKNNDSVDTNWVDNDGNVTKKYVKDDADNWLMALRSSEKSYLSLIQDNGWIAQQAASILPQTTAATMVISGYSSGWTHLFDLRYRGTTGKPLPQAQELAELMHIEFNKKGIDL